MLLRFNSVIVFVSGSFLLLDKLHFVERPPFIYLSHEHLGFLQSCTLVRKTAVNLSSTNSYLDIYFHFL